MLEFKPGTPLLVRVDEHDQPPQWYHLSKGAKTWVLRLYSPSGVTRSVHEPGLVDLLTPEHPRALGPQMTLEECGLPHVSVENIEHWSNVLARLARGELSTEEARHGQSISERDPDSDSKTKHPRQPLAPVVPLRHLYETMSHFYALERQLHFVQAITDAPGKLAEWFLQSVRDFASYENREEVLWGERKPDQPLRALE